MRPDGLGKAYALVRTETSDVGFQVDMYYAAFGKGRGKCHSWQIYRDGEYVGYGSIQADAEVNFQRVMAGLVRNPETGNYEKRAAL